MTAKARMLIVLCTAVFMLFAWTGVAGALPSDIQGHWAQQEISDWVNQGLSSGYADGTFQPDNPITRAEFITLVNRSFDFTAAADVTYSDVSSTDWFYNEIARAKAAGYISGCEDNTMRPDNAIVRQEVAAILVRLLDIQDIDETTLQIFHDAGAIQAWARPAVAAVVKSSLMKGYPDQTFLPESPITRAEALVSLQRALDSRQPSTPTTTAIVGVVTQNGSPVKDATVRVYQAGSFDLLKEAITDGSGSYSVQLPPGQYDLTAGTADSVAYASAFTVKEDEVTAGNMSLQPGTVAEGTILDASGDKLAGAEVLFTTNPTFRAVTDSQGRYLIVLLPNHHYTVRLSQKGQSEEEPSILFNDLEVGAAGKQSIAALTFSQPGVSGGGGAAGGGDTTAPIINAASISVSSGSRTVTISSNGLHGSADLSGLSGTEKIVSGTINVSETSTLVLRANAGIPIEVSQALAAGSNTLEIIEYLSYLEILVGPDGDSLSSLRAILGSSATFEGTMTDAAGNVSDVSLTVQL